MNQSIFDLLRRISTLLHQCGWDEKSRWFLDRSAQLQSAAKGSDEFLAALDQLDSAITGMGSFTDLPLTPVSEQMTIQEARSQQWDLAEALGNAIEELRQSC